MARDDRGWRVVIPIVSGKDRGGGRWSFGGIAVALLRLLGWRIR